MKKLYGDIISTFSALSLNKIYILLIQNFRDLVEGDLFAPKSFIKNFCF